MQKKIFSFHCHHVGIKIQNSSTFLGTSSTVYIIFRQTAVENVINSGTDIVSFTVYSLLV